MNETMVRKTVLTVAVLGFVGLLVTIAVVGTIADGVWNTCSGS